MLNYSFIPDADHAQVNSYEMISPVKDAQVVQHAVACASTSGADLERHCKTIRGHTFIIDLKYRIGYHDLMLCLPRPLRPHQAIANDCFKLGEYAWKTCTSGLEIPFSASLSVIGCCS